LARWSYTTKNKIKEQKMASLVVIEIKNQLITEDREELTNKLGRLINDNLIIGSPSFRKLIDHGWLVLQLPLPYPALHLMSML